MYIEILTLSIIIDIDRQHWKSCTAVATSEWHTVKICKHSHNRLIDNIGDYLYFKNQRMEASNLKLIHISSTWDCTTFHNFLPMFQKKKKDFQKLAGLWLADEVVNHVGIYGSKAAEGLSAFQRRSCWLCSHHRIIMKFSGVITNDKSKVHAKGQGQRSKVKVTEVTTQLNRFRTVTPVWILIWWWNDAYSLMLLRRGALLFFKVIRQNSRSHGSKNRRIWPRLGVSGL